MKNKIFSFQVIRACAMMLIFLSHCDFLIRFEDDNCIKYLGGAGVSLFIALSGFLSAYHYREKTEKTFTYYIARWKQFYKLHFLTLLLAVPLTVGALKHNIFKWITLFVINASLTQAMFPIKSVYFSFNAVSWYLSLMMCFALLTPIAVFVWKRLTIKSSILLFAVVALFEFGGTFFLGNKTYFHWLAYIFPITRFFDFVVGGGCFVIAEHIRVNGLKKLNSFFLFWGVCILSFAAIASCFIDNNFFLTAAWTAPATIIVAALSNTDCYREKNVIRWLIGFGDVSFEFFLIHQLVIRYISLIFERLHISHVFSYVFAFFISYSFAWIIHNRIIGKMAKRLKY